MEPSIFKLLLVVVVIFVVFGAGKLPTVMGDFGRGIKSLKDGLKGESADKKPEDNNKIEG